MLRETFLDLATKYSGNPALAKTCWDEIEKNYSEKKRHYHTLVHLNNLFQQLTGVKEQIKDWDTILFTLFYHDVVYRSTKTDNEEKSALLAQKRMQQLRFPEERISRCLFQIRATKGHSPSHDNDTDIFIDADLSVLGQNWKTYYDYYKRIRKEYSIYPDFMYNPGRKKVLQHFLGMEKIFKTQHFFDKFEMQARQNMNDELKEF